MWYRAWNFHAPAVYKFIVRGWISPHQHFHNDRETKFKKPISADWATFVPCTSGFAFGRWPRHTCRMRCQTRSPIQSQQCCLNGPASDGLIAAHAPVCFDSRSGRRSLSFSVFRRSRQRPVCRANLRDSPGDSRARARPTSPHTCL